MKTKQLVILAEILVVTLFPGILAAVLCGVAR